MFCRLAAQELSLLSPRLSQENIRLVGIGLEQLGVEEFVEKKFWAGGKPLQVLIFLHHFFKTLWFNEIICQSFYSIRVVHRWKEAVI